VLPGVKGRVVEVPVQSNTPLTEGDVLFRIDPKPYEYAIEQKRASIAEAEQAVQQLKASLDEATANVEKANVQLRLQEDNYNRQVQLFSRQVIAQATLDVAQRNYDGAKQALAGAQAAEERARLAYTSEVGGVNPTVARLRAELSDAEYDLAQTTTRAPTKGFVTQLALRPGMYVVPAPLRPVMVFIHTGDRDRALSAAFQQNALQRVRSGDEAEIAFDAVPGRVFKGKVHDVLDAIASGYRHTFWTRDRAGGVFEKINAEVHLQPGKPLLFAFLQALAVNFRIVRFGGIGIAANLVAKLAAEHLVNRNVIGFPGQIPQSHLNRAHSAGLARVAAKLLDLPKYFVDVAGIFAQDPALQLERIIFVRPVANFAESVKTLIRIDADDRVGHRRLRYGGDAKIGNFQLGRLRVGIHLLLVSFKSFVCPKTSGGDSRETLQKTTAARRKIRHRIPFVEQIISQVYQFVIDPSGRW